MKIIISCTIGLCETGKKIVNHLLIKPCYFHKDRGCLELGSEVRFRSWGEWWVVVITLQIYAVFLIQRSELCLQYITTAGYVILCKLLPKFHNSWNKQESLNVCASALLKAEKQPYRSFCTLPSPKYCNMVRAEHSSSLVFTKYLFYF